MYGIMYGVKRTTVYFPDEMKAAIEREAARRGVTEAEVVRGALEAALSESRAPMHKLPVFPEGFGTEIGTRVDELLDQMADDILDGM